MSDKNISRLRRAKKTRMKIKDQDSPRLSDLLIYFVFR